MILFFSHWNAEFIKVLLKKWVFIPIILISNHNGQKILKFNYSILIFKGWKWLIKSKTLRLDKLVYIVKDFRRYSSDVSEEQMLIVNDLYIYKE